MKAKLTRKNAHQWVEKHKEITKHSKYKVVRHVPGESVLKFLFELLVLRFEKAQFEIRYRKQI
jgi:ribosomal protein L17